ncbi:hypothetical protein KCP76_14530 [Salmonella enterica subsp. enterica serovar Weltevreden]|nr:hypothetical protein KCP76_14530 [Salmonella enterica subsp. enterica serovar Weltevreden]
MVLSYLSEIHAQILIVGFQVVRLCGSVAPFNGIDGWLPSATLLQVKFTGGDAVLRTIAEVTNIFASISGSLTSINLPALLRAGLRHSNGADMVTCAIRCGNGRGILSPRCCLAF